MASYWSPHVGIMPLHECTITKVLKPLIECLCVISAINTLITNDLIRKFVPLQLHSRVQRGCV